MKHNYTFHLAVALISIVLVNVVSMSLTSLFNPIADYSTLGLLVPRFRLTLFYLIFYIILWLAAKRLSVTVKSQVGDLRVGNKGNSRFTTRSEIKRTYKEIEYTPNYINGLHLDSYPGRSGSLIARSEDKAYIDTDDAHSVTIAPTRAGKGQTKVIPEIEIRSRSEERPHMIISSVKYELLELTATELEERGYKIEVLNLDDLDQSLGYNCLDLIKDSYSKGEIDEAVELCKTFSHPLYHNPNSKEPIWEESAMALVNALILALCHEFVNPELPEEEQHPEFVTMNAIVSMLIELSGTYQLSSETRYMLDEYFNTLPLDNPARKEYSTVGVTSGQMRSSIFGTALAKLQKFAAPKVSNLMAESTFDFMELTQSEVPYAVFIVLPDYIETNYIIASTWIQQCYYVLSRFASQNNDRLNKRVWFCLDEFGNLPSFTNLNSMISVGAGRGMLFDFIVQDLIQFKIKYGADIARFVETQLMNIVFLKSTDPDTRKRISSMLGEEEVIQFTRSGHAWSLNKNVSEQVEKKPLLFPSELNQLQEGENVIIRAKRKTDPVNGEVIDMTPYPILNDGKYRFRKAYQYLDKTFKHKDYQQLTYTRHGGEQWDEKQLTLFISTIRDRLKHSKQKEIAKQEQRYQLETELAQLKEELESEDMIALRERYDLDSTPSVDVNDRRINDYNPTNQTIDEATVEDTSEKQSIAEQAQSNHNRITEIDKLGLTLEEVKEIARKHIPELKDGLNKAKNDGQINELIKRYSSRIELYNSDN
ncbi:VirD4-like conjugal transfer protein, CD1115 family [Hutsoniella sourekii]|uniref:VirD4-like conjugal transfer protein, CD1115 family n=1 Tax=Hutsoniella sourekii TaxID=87650 RepID=UPI0004B40D66|nr:type IV secretory system conjugative DNA transfer family protein [Hutsoniella sourekii]